jgi:16S rRNA (guanine1207-N2)-methyltransferase
MPLVPHYFDPEPAIPSQRRELSLDLPDVQLRLTSDSGVFAAERVDSGTRFLLRRAPQPPAAGELLDLGCGYGVIAVTLALRSPGARVWAVDVNQRALDLTRANAAAAGVPTIVASTPDQVPPDVSFDAIYSNPPVRVGLAVLRPLLSRWCDRLSPQGAAYLVVHRHLGSDSLARWLTEEGYPCVRLASHAGYRILRVQPRQAVGDDLP